MEELKDILAKHLTRLMRQEEESAEADYAILLQKLAHANALHSSAAIDNMVKLETNKYEKIISEYITNVDAILKSYKRKLELSERLAIIAEVSDIFKVNKDAFVRPRFEKHFLRLFKTDDTDARKRDVIDECAKSQEEKCLEQVALLIDSHNLSVDSVMGINQEGLYELLSTAGYSETAQHLQEAQTDIVKKPAGSIGSSKCAIEALLKATLKKAGIVFDSDETIPALWKKCKEHFYQKGLLRRSDGTGKHYEEIVGKISGLIGDITHARNDLSDQHATGGETLPKDTILAELLFGIVCVLCLLILRLDTKDSTE